MKININQRDYAIVYSVPLIYKRLPVIEQVLIVTTLIAITTVLSLFFWFNIQSFKYHPSSLFLSYGIAVSILLYEFVSFITVQKKKIPNCFIWFSKNSFNIYFIHIFILYFFQYGLILSNFWWLQYLILIISFAILAFLLELIRTKLRTFVFHKDNSESI